MSSHNHPRSRASRRGNVTAQWEGRIHPPSPDVGPGSGSQPQQAVRRTHRPQHAPSNNNMPACYPLKESSPFPTNANFRPQTPTISSSNSDEGRALTPLTSDPPRSSISNAGTFSQLLSPSSGPYLDHQARVRRPLLHTHLTSQNYAPEKPSVQRPLPPRHGASSQPPQTLPYQGDPTSTHYSGHGSHAYTDTRRHLQGGWQNPQPSGSQPCLSEAYSEAYPESNAPVQSHDLNLRPSHHGGDQSRHYFKNGEFRATNSNITFIGGDQTNNNGGDADRRAMKKLKDHCAPSALLNSKERFDIPSCANETRTAVLHTLIAWVERAGLSALLGWLRGPAGAGKSTIAQTLAVECKKKGLLAASFFFSRTGSAERADGDRFIPTIILQLILAFPELRPLVLAAISANPIFFDQSRRDQLEELLIKLFHNDEAELSHKGDRSDTSPFRFRGSARLIVIDGLDECNDLKVQIDLLKIIADATRRLPHPFRFLIVSRPEAHISHTFNHELILQDDNPLRVDLEDDPDADADIRHYLELEFNRMRTQHPNHQLLPSPWPPAGAIDTLVERASKQFIYPAVALTFIWNNEDLPDHNLKLILDLKLAIRSSEKPLAVLDELYTFVFSKIPDKHLDTIARLFALLSYDFSGRPICNVGETIRSTTFLERCLRLSSGQLWIMLKPLLSLLSIPSNPRKSIKIYHASLSDFLENPNRSNRLRFRFSEGRGWEALALYWLHLDQPERAARRFCEAAANADLTNELKQAILNHDFSFKFTPEKKQGMWSDIGAFVEMLRERHDVHYEDFALLRHHTSKIIRLAEAELIKRRIWPSGKTFEAPTPRFDETVSNIHYCLVDALCRFCILVGWGLCAGLEGFPFNHHECRLLLIFLGWNRNFADYFTLEIINHCAQGLRRPMDPLEDKDRVVRLIAKQVVQSRLRELSQFHEPEEVERVMYTCCIISLTEV